MKPRKVSSGRNNANGLMQRETGLQPGKTTGPVVDGSGAREQNG